MTIEEKLQNFILMRYKSVLEFTTAIDMPYSTMTSIFRRGVNNSSVTNIIKICSALEISADELAKGRIVQFIQTEDEKQKTCDVEKAVDQFKRSLTCFERLEIAGKEMTDEDINALLSGIDITIGIIKKRKESKQ